MSAKKIATTLRIIFVVGFLSEERSLRTREAARRPKKAPGSVEEKVPLLRRRRGRAQ